uniref:Phospholipase A2-like domain-containing protein n=1 Tax=Periparus ater parvoviridae sp. TaxID=2794527 RepID=A0A8A4XBW0_9VIRU|nr:MAG: hypothetical protein [Periparus ater parvoviridae sp.]
MRFLFPGHRYLGPGNKLDNGKPVDVDDEIAQEHDSAYHQAKSEADIFKADGVAISKFNHDFASNHNFHSLVGSAGLNVKNFVEESVLGRVLYPSMKRAGPSHANEVTPEKRPNQETQINSPSISSSYDPSQGSSNATNGGSVAAVEGGITGSGGGSSMSSGGQGLLFEGSPQDQVWQDIPFKKTYRWTLGTSLPSYLKSTSQFLLKPGSLYTMPTHQVSTFLSPSEYKQLSQFPMAKIKDIAMHITSLGIRLPFFTNATDTVTANANSQYPIVQMSSDFDKYYRVQQTSAQAADIRSKMLGDDPNGWANSATFTENFTNLSARTTSRDYTMETILNIDEGAYQNVGGATVRFQNYYGTPNIHEMVMQTKNGTTELGPVFSYSYKPKNSTFQTVSTHNMRINAGVQNTNGTPYGTNQLHNQGFTGLGPNISNNTNEIQNSYIPSPVQQYNNARVENMDTVDAMGNFTNHRQPCFIIGTQFIRNQDDSLLSAKWEIIMDCTINISYRVGTKGIYGLNPDLLISQNLFPSMCPGSYGTSGATGSAWTYGGELRDANGGAVYTGAFNRPTAVVQVRTAADIAPYPGAPNAAPMAISENDRMIANTNATTKTTNTVSKSIPRK